MNWRLLDPTARRKPHARLGAETESARITPSPKKSRAMSGHTAVKSFSIGLAPSVPSGTRTKTATSTLWATTPTYEGTSRFDTLKYLH